MKSYEEMAQNVFRRGDEQIRKRQKRISAVKKGVPVMSLFSIITVLGLGIMSAHTGDGTNPEIPKEIDFETIQSTVQTTQNSVTETESVTESAADYSLANTTAAFSTTAPQRTGDFYDSENRVSDVYTTAPQHRPLISSPPVNAAVIGTTVVTTNTETVSSAADSEPVIVRDSDQEFDYMIKSDGTIEIIKPESDKYEHFEKLVIPSEIDGRKVTSIGECAFVRLNNLSEVYMPDTLISIGASAFNECSSLKHVKFSESVKIIDEFAFFSCSSLSDIYFPENAVYERIRYNAFGQTLWLKEKIAEGSIVTINNVLYDGSNACGNVVIPSGITYICDDAFTGNLSVKSVSLPEGTEYIGRSAFSYCSELESVYIPASIRNMESKAFANCSSLENVTLADGLTVIGEAAFNHCNYIKNIDLPDSITSIGIFAFSDTTSLEKISIVNPDCEIYDAAETLYDGTVIYGYTGSTAESYAEKYDRTFVAIDAEEQVSGTWGSNTSWTLNDTTLTISGNGAMDSISYFTNVYHNKFGNAPDKFKEDYPWSEYYDIITDVIIEEGITTIPEGAFCYYPELKNVELPDSLESIMNNSFICCYNLREITIPENTVIKHSYPYAEPFGYSICTYTTESGIDSSELEEMAAFYETERRNAKNYHLTINGYDFSSSYYYCILDNSCSFNSIGTANNPFIAPSGSAGNGITWSFSDMGTMTFSGNGVIESAGLDSAAIETAPYVRKIVFDNGITGIGDFAFSEFDFIEEVEFSDTVTEIGDAAFVSSMKTMGSVVIPKSVKKIGTNSICTKNGKIYGYSDTAVETYANENNLVFVAIDKKVTGDINCDGSIDLNDATSVLSFYAELSAGFSSEFDPDTQINSFLKDIADVNSDGKIDVSDATLILEMYAKNASGIS